MVLLANRLVWIDYVGDDGERILSKNDQTFIFWIRERDIWGEPYDAIAATTLTMQLMGLGLPENTRGLYFEVSDSRAAAAFVLMAILFGWDAYLIPLSCLYLCHISHDGYVGLESENEGTLKELFDRVSGWDAQFTTGGATHEFMEDRPAAH
jgi:hypothetical protein